MPHDGEIEKEFERTGAVLVRGVLSPEEVAGLREEILRTFGPLDQRAAGAFVRCLSARMMLRLPSVMQTILHPRIVETLKTILEPHYTIIPDFNLQRNMFDFTDTRRSLTHLFGLIGAGWHHDAGTEGASPYLFDPQYRMVKCGIYLQDNTLEWGGGIEIAPAGHTVPLRSGVGRLDYAAMRVHQIYSILSRGQRVELKAGDFIAFHALLPHRGSLPHGLRDRITESERRAGFVRIPPERSKLVIYFNSSRAQFAQSYMRHCLARGADELHAILGGKSREMLMSDFPGLRYPQDYPAEFVDLARARGVTVAQLDADAISRGMEIRDTAIQSGMAVNAV